MPTNSINVDNCDEITGQALSVYYANVRGFTRHKLSELSLLVHKNNIDIIAISETWAQGKCDAEVCLPGFSLYRKDRHIGLHGGVLLMVCNRLKSSSVENLNCLPFSESVFCQIETTAGAPLTVGCIYRSPASSDENNAALCNLLRSCQIPNCCVVGDFNFPDIDWPVFQGRRLCDCDFVEAVVDAGFVQHVSLPTRLNPDHILDLVLSNDERIVDSIDVGDPLGSSDHNCIMLSVNVFVKGRSDSVAAWDISHANWDRFCICLGDVDWVKCLADADNVNEMWGNYEHHILDCMSLSIPLRRCGSKQLKKPMWATNSCWRAMRQKSSKYKKWKRNRTLPNWRDFIASNDAAEDAIYHSTKFFEAKLASSIKNDRRSFFKYARSKLRLRSKIGPLEKPDCTLSSDSLEMAEILNNQFASVFTKEDTSLLPTSLHKTANQLTSVVFTEAMVLHAIANTPCHGSAGHDNIPAVVLVKSRYVFARPLASLYQACMDNGTIPSAWKLARVVPIFKKGPTRVKSNYRPISLTSVVCKLMERIIVVEMANHIQMNCALNSSQHGFLRGHSCVTQLLEFVTDITHILNDGLCADVIFFDLSKAFDKVPHQRLLTKVASFGISGDLLSLLKDYLSGRSQFVSVHGKDSSVVPVTSGVPQGSVVGPLLFIIYVDDMDVGVTSALKKFADDTKAYKGFPRDDYLRATGEMQQDINTLQRWESTWLMQFNPEKCKVMHLGTGNPQTTYYMGATALSAVTEEKDLGVLISSDFKFSKHCSSIVATAHRQLGMIRRTIVSRDKRVLVPLYIALVRPLLEYCCSIWSPHLVKDVVAIEKVQRSFTRLFPELRGLPYESRLISLRLHSLQFRRIRTDLIELFKALKGHSGLNFDAIFSYAPTTRGHSLTLARPGVAKLNCFYYAFANRVVPIWNSLPESAVKCDTINEFKGWISKLFTNGAFQGYLNRF